jgi:hypothetical protein
MYLIIILGFILRIILSTLDYNFQILSQSQFDSLSFHLEAVKFSNFLTNNELKDLVNYNWRIGWVYSALIGSLYYLFTPSILLGSYTSCIFWFLSAIVFRKVLIQLKIDNSKINICLIFYTFLLPTSIIYPSIILRESLMLLLANLIILIAINFKITKKKKKMIIFVFCFLIILPLFAMLHRANIIISIIALSLIVIFYIKKKIRINNLIFFIIIFITSVVLIQNGVTEKIFIEIINYQKGHFFVYNYDRAAYYSIEDIYTPLDYSLKNLIILIMKNTLNYFIQPSFTNITSIKDLILSIENLIRLALVIFILNNLNFNIRNKPIILWCFTIFLLNEIIFAQATVNWGSASRHHLTVMGYLLLASFLNKKKY